jgi:hypothetical protein
MLFLASFSTPLIGTETEFINTTLECRQEIPASMREHAEYYIEHFDYENIDTAVRIGWCESRGNETAYRSDNRDSGIMQFIPSTWNWIAKLHDLPKWNEWVVMRYGRPYNGPTSKSDIGFEFTKVQFSPYYNILFASLLAEDTYNRTQWRDWNSSKWCWENENKWEKLWKAET